MKKTLSILAVAIFAGGVFVGGALATGPVSAQAPNARLAVLIDGGATAGNFQILRQKGVMSVTNPFAGVFCIKPSSATMALEKIVPNVSTEFRWTLGATTKAAWDSGGAGLNCPVGTITVIGWKSDGSFNNNVGFTLTVD